jgi:hypothetical protein
MDFGFLGWNGSGCPGAAAFLGGKVCWKILLLDELLGDAMAVCLLHAQEVDACREVV